MRCLAWISSFALFAVSGCGGDSSVVMSSWSDGSIPSGAGGQGGTVGGQGGSLGGGSVVVPGGTRDLATTQCTEATGTTCAVPVENLRCLDENCGASLAECYLSDGVSAAVGGRCQALADCVLRCPCDSDGKKCQDNCVGKHAPVNSDCGNCLYGLLSCLISSGCPSLWSCTLASI